MTRASDYLRVLWLRHLPGARSRVASVAFRHGWHAGYHRAAGAPCPGRACEIVVGMEQINAVH